LKRKEFRTYDLHVWTITSGREALSAHVIHAYSISQPNLLKELRTKLHERFGVDHLTIQMETPDFEQSVSLFALRERRFRSEGIRACQNRELALIEDQ
jgi:cobalt-zinc-cadmium efflux system protein